MLFRDDAPLEMVESPEAFPRGEAVRYEYRYDQWGNWITKIARHAHITDEEMNADSRLPEAVMSAYMGSLCRRLNPGVHRKFTCVEECKLDAG